MTVQYKTCIRKKVVTVSVQGLYRLARYSGKHIGNRGDDDLSLPRPVIIALLYCAVHVRTAVSHATGSEAEDPSGPIVSHSAPTLAHSSATPACRVKCPSATCPLIPRASQRFPFSEGPRNGHAENDYCTTTQQRTCLLDLEQTGAQRNRSECKPRSSRRVPGSDFPGDYRCLQRTPLGRSS